VWRPALGRQTSLCVELRSLWRAHGGTWGGLTADGESRGSAWYVWTALVCQARGGQRGRRVRARQASYRGPRLAFLSLLACCLVLSRWRAGTSSGWRVSCSYCLSGRWGKRDPCLAGRWGERDLPLWASYGDPGATVLYVCFLHCVCVEWALRSEGAVYGAINNLVFVVFLRSCGVAAAR